MDGGAGKTKGRPQLVFDVALVRKMEQLLVVDENDKGGGPHADLGHVV